MATSSSQCETTTSTYTENGETRTRTSVRLKLWNSTVSGNESKTSTVRVAQDYAYGIKGLPANATVTVTVQETSIPTAAGGKITFADFTGAKPSSSASATECGDDKTNCKTATVTPTPAETISSKTVTLKGLGTVDSTTKAYLPASAVAKNTYTPNTPPVTPVVLPNTGGSFGGIWVWFLVGFLILLLGFALYAFDLRGRSA